MRLLLDTTYFLPAIGIAVKSMPMDVPIKLMSRNHEIFLSNISIFELSAKGAKYVALEMIPLERVTRGIQALVHSEKINIVEIHDSSILHTAFKIRGILNDFIDCLILSSAINCCEVLITEDMDIHDIKEDEKYKALIAAKNPKFKIYRLAEIL